MLEHSTLPPEWPANSGAVSLRSQPKEWKFPLTTLSEPMTATKSWGLPLCRKPCSRRVRWWASIAISMSSLRRAQVLQVPLMAVEWPTLPTTKLRTGRGPDAMTAYIPCRWTPLTVLLIIKSPLTRLRT